jgi:dUTP pyrophosphatase
MKLKIKRFRKSSVLPEYQTVDAAGFDFHADIDQPVTIQPGGHQAFPTGVGVEIPSGYELQVRPRSGLAYKFQVSMLNGIGTIDADYRGEINVLLINYGQSEFVVEPGMRIAQGVINKIEQISWQEVDELAETERGQGGFGSTGVK